MSNNSLYETLDINKNASADEIKKAYRRLARKYHPDINKEKGAEEKFKEINAAYEILSDPKKKAQYDQYGDSMFGGQSFGDFSRSTNGADINDILNSIFGGAGGFGGFSSKGFKSSGFGNFGGFSQGFGGEDLDVNARIKIPFELGILGGEHSFTYQGETIKIKIPYGLKSGEKLRVRNKGKQLGTQRGDLILQVELEESNEYERDDDDLIKKVDISLRTALFGTDKLSIKTPRKEVSIKLAPNSKNGQKIRLKGYGVQNRKSGYYGDMYLILNVILPNTQTMDKDLLKALEEKLPKD
ncbi:DnaJ family protein [Campylobacter sp. MIT 99-7217]|uniref:DnaJ C-terminal domain-containing protein n=1 Tax=Campylobacter sp. MIT 99-7217 TaxID=535091 RepID=UPI00115BAEFA|nr:J domain-containing protein [Campylobacter sp. MIT 99-7217]TQR32974.1 DnaJ family protein [Campylobacter sp. MIT 99-7217]